MTHLDLLDQQLIELLSKNASMTSRQLAQELSASASTVRRRLKQLVESGALRIAAICNQPEMGLPVGLLIGLGVDRVKIDSILQDLSKQKEVNWVSTSFGRFDIVAFGRFRSTDALSSFVQHDLTRIQGIRSSETFLCLREVKSPFGEHRATPVRTGQRSKQPRMLTRLDWIDERIIELSRQDAHISYRQLAKLLVISPATARRRLKRLIQDGVLRIIAFPDPRASGGSVAALIALKADPNRVDKILQLLARRPDVIWASATLGRFDIVASLWFHSSDELSGFIQKDIVTMQGISGSEIFPCLHQTKGVYFR